jgi:hypothetical protein
VSKIEHGATHTDGLERQGGFGWAQSINTLDPSCPNDTFAIDLHAIGIPKKKRFTQTPSFPAYRGPRTHVRTHARTHALMHCCGAARPLPRCDRIVRACEIMH